MTTFSYPLYAGGGASAIWCWLIAGAGAADAHVVSRRGGLRISHLGCPVLYHQVPRPCEEYVPVIAWVDGWLNLIGQICGSASSACGASQMLLAAVSIGSDFVPLSHPGPRHWRNGRPFCIFHGAVNSMSTAWLNHITKTYAVFHIAILIAASRIAPRTPERQARCHVCLHQCRAQQRLDAAWILFPFWLPVGRVE